MKKIAISAAIALFAGGCAVRPVDEARFRRVDEMAQMFEECGLDAAKLKKIIERAEKDDAAPAIKDQTLYLVP